jgi:nitrate/TMAO reductase-like tetraheme cytochrome c subunit
MGASGGQLGATSLSLRLESAWRLAVVGLLSIAGILTAWKGASLGATPIPPTNLNRPSYDYSNADSCPSCHFIEGYDHTARAAGLQWNDTTQQWERTGHGWWDSAHAQSQFGWSQPSSQFGWTQPSSTYGSNDNTFCSYCHSPLQASGTAQFSNGAVVNPVTVQTFQAVTCSACHTSNTVAAALLKQYPTALSGGETATLIRGQDPTNPNSWIPLLPGQENQFCLTCHEQDPHDAQANSIFQVMYSAGVTCIDCHMAPYQIFTGTASNPAPALPERFHDWKVAENVPYSCGAQGSLSQFSCHSEFTAQSASAFIPVLTQQHGNWWSLPPFTTSSAANQSAEAAAPISAHELTTPADYLNLWRQIQATQEGATQ